jgi:hypothetical protein
MASRKFELAQLRTPLTDYVTGSPVVVQDRCEPGCRFRKCKIGATIDLACDDGACGAARLWIDARHPLARFCWLYHVTYLIAKHFCLFSTRLVAFHAPSEKLPTRNSNSEEAVASKSMPIVNRPGDLLRRRKCALLEVMVADTDVTYFIAVATRVRG